jgi:hypothetical protein
MREITPEIFRLYVDGKYVDYYGSLKRAEITARMYNNQGKKCQIFEDTLDGSLIENQGCMKSMVYNK